jgi:capsular exopolysaccharide synthesis family protein
MSDLTPSPAELPATDGYRQGRAAPPPEILDGEFREVHPPRLRDHVRMLYKHRWLAASCFLACICAAVVITALTPRVYTASARIQVSRSAPIKLQLEHTVLNAEEAERILNGASSFVATQVQALKSRDVAERTVQTYRLAENPAFAEAAGGAAHAATTLPLPSFLQPRGLAASVPGDAPALPAEPEGVVDPVLLDRYMGYLSVEDTRGTDLISISFTAPSPTLAAFLAAAHVQSYVGLVKESQVAMDSTAIRFLGDQVADARARVERAEAALADFAAQHPQVAVNQEDQLIGKQITDLSALLGNAEGRRVSAQSRYDMLVKAKKAPLQHVLNESDAIAKLRLVLLDAQAKEAALKQRLGPNHSQMRELRQQITELRLQLDNEVAQEIAAARARLQEATLRETDLRGRLEEREQKAAELRALGGQYEMHKGEIDSARGLYASLLKQKNDTAVHSELAASNVRVIERPEVPRVATRPRVRVNLLFGAVAGLVLAVGAAFFRESLDNSVKSSAEAEDLLQLPTLAIIPNFALAALPGRGRLLPLRAGPAAKRNGAATRSSGLANELVVAGDPWSPVAETFRILRTALLFSSAGPAPQVILVTSAAAGEGKTVTALNLASALAESGRRVLLVDVDLRHPGCHTLLRVPLRPGLSNYLDGGTELARVVRELKSPRLSFISAGPRPANPADLVGSERMRAALDELRGHYDFIVLDSPPVLPVTDAVLLARRADSVLLVLKGQAAPSDLVRRARDQLVLAGARVSGVVVNNVTRSWGNYPLYDSYPHYHGTRPMDASAPGGAAREA